MTNGNDGGWGASGAGGSDWEDWNSPPDPETNQFEAIDWFDNQGAAAGAGQARWYGQGDPSHWNQPTEQQPRKKTWPIVVGVAIGAVVLLAAGGVGLLLAGGDDDYVIATETASTSTPGTAGWTTSSSTTTRESQVVPATSGSSCSKSDIASDLGWDGVNHLDCYGDWAVVSKPTGSGDGSVIHLVNGTWSTTGYGPSGCAPQSVLSSFPSALVSKYFKSCGSSNSGSDRSRKSSTTRRPATRTTTRTTTRTSTRTTTVRPEARPPVIEVTIPPVVPEIQSEPTTSAAPTSSSQPTSTASAAQATSPSSTAQRNSDEG